MCLLLEIKREVNRRRIYECRCDERLRVKVEGSTRLVHTGWRGGMKNLKIDWLVYYEVRKRKPNMRLIHECRCDERLKARAEGSTRLAYTDSVRKWLRCTVSLIYIGRQVIRQSILYLFLVSGVPPRIYFQWQGFPPADKRFSFFRLLGFPDEEMVGDREARQPGGELEITAGSVQTKDHDRCRSIFHQPLACWRITGSGYTKYWI